MNDQMNQNSEKQMPAPILITGCARSGTSLVAGCINMCGAFGGHLAGKTKNNMKGMFENTYIREGLVKPYLRSIKVDPLGQYPLPDVTKLPIPSDWKQKVENVLQTEGYKSGPWFYKGAKCVLLFPLWHYAFPNAKWIIVRRRTGDIVRSCLNTGFMRAFRNPDNQRAVGVQNEEEGWIWWVNQHLDGFRAMIDIGMNCKVIWPERMVDGDYRQLYETIEWLGLKWNSEVLSFIDPKLWKARNKYSEEGAKLATTIVEKAGEVLGGDAVQPQDSISGDT